MIIHENMSGVKLFNVDRWMDKYDASNHTICFANTHKKVMII
jgi:hypothetical protein